MPSRPARIGNILVNPFPSIKTLEYLGNQHVAHRKIIIILNSKVKKKKEKCFLTVYLMSFCVQRTLICEATHIGYQGGIVLVWRGGGGGGGDKHDHFLLLLATFKSQRERLTEEPMTF